MRRRGRGRNRCPEWTRLSLFTEAPARFHEKRANLCSRRFKLVIANSVYFIRLMRKICRVLFNFRRKFVCVRETASPLVGCPKRLSMIVVALVKIIGSFKIEQFRISFCSTSTTNLSHRPGMLNDCERVISQSARDTRDMNPRDSAVNQRR